MKPVVHLLIFLAVIANCPVLMAEEKLPLVISSNGIEKLTGKHVQVAGTVEKQSDSPAGKYRMRFSDNSTLPVWGVCAACDNYESAPVIVTAWVFPCGSNAQCAGLTGLKNVESVQMDEDCQDIAAEVLALFAPDAKSANVSFSNLRVSGIKAFIDVVVSKDHAEHAAGINYLCFLVKANGKWRVRMRQDLSTF